MFIDSAKASVGMTLLADVNIAGGKTLAARGTVLTEPLITRIKAMGVKSLSVDQAPSAPQAAASARPAATAASPAATAPLGNVPILSVSIESDRLAAHLYIRSSSAEDSLSVADVMAALARERVTAGVHTELVEKAVASFKAGTPLLEIRNIAVGRHPSSAHGGVLIKVKFLRDKSQIEAARKMTFAWELADKHILFERVAKGGVVAAKQSEEVPGFDVYGDEIPVETDAKNEIARDEGIQVSPDGRSYLAEKDGVVYFAENHIGIIPLTFDGSADVSVSSDGMKAEVKIHPPADGGKAPSEDDLRRLLTKAGVKNGILDAELRAMLTEMFKGVYPAEPVVIARGLPPAHGANGKVEYLFNTQTSLTPPVDQLGNADFKNVDIIQAVATGAKLANLIPPTKGVPGLSILGVEIKATDGNPLPPPTGANTQVSPTDPLAIVSTADGNIRLLGKLIDVSEGFTVKGNVDFGTGNIEYEKSVIIAGDIKSGFSVTCGGDLQVSGTIEDAEITVGGSVLCKLGFVGQGRGRIEAKGDVNIGFTKNQTIRCHGSISIAKEALNCTLLSRKSITVCGQTLSAAGGHLAARESITLKVVGSESGAKTLVEVGYDFTIADEKAKTDKQLTELAENKRKLLETFQKLERMFKIKKTLPPNDMAMYIKLRDAIQKYDIQAAALEQRKAALHRKMLDFENSFIRIERSAMPGTIFRIGERQHLVREELIGPKTVRLNNFELSIA